LLPPGDLPAPGRIPFLAEKYRVFFFSSHPYVLCDARLLGLTLKVPSAFGAMLVTVLLRRFDDGLSFWTPSKPTDRSFPVGILLFRWFFRVSAPAPPFPLICRIPPHNNIRFVGPCAHSRIHAPTCRASSSASSRMLTSRLILPRVVGYFLVRSVPLRAGAPSFFPAFSPLSLSSLLLFPRFKILGRQVFIPCGNRGPFFPALQIRLFFLGFVVLKEAYFYQMLSRLHRTGRSPLLSAPSPLPKVLF